MIYYKVLSYKNGNLYSCIAGGNAQIQYKKDEFVQAPEWLQKINYHLLVFDSKLTAIDFMRNNPGGKTVLYTCEIKNIIKNLPLCFSFPGLLNKLTNFTTFNYPNLINWPNGTIMVKEVKLIKEVSFCLKEVQTGLLPGYHYCHYCNNYYNCTDHQIIKAKKRKLSFRRGY